MQEEELNDTRSGGRGAAWLTALCVVLLSLGLWALLSVWTNTPFAGKSSYCTYTLQAMAWRNGSLSLGKDYPWLELAVYEGDWYVSFPPTPTVPVYLLTFFFGDNVPDNLLIKLYALIGMLAVFFALRKRQGNLRASFIALMTGFCGSAAALATQGAVWYQAQMLAFCLTEPDAGSDAGGVMTSAVDCGDYYLLNGRKRFASGAPMADYALVFARTDPSQRGSRGISLFIVDMKLPGVECGAHEDKMGIRGYPTSDISFTDVHVPKDCLMGPLHRGFSTAMKTLDGGRLGIAAQALGIAQGCLDEAVTYARTRKQFGKTIGSFEGVSFMLADMATELQAARELVYSTAVLKDTGSPETSVRCAMSKYYAAEMCNRVAYKAVQVFGGYGYIKGYKVERLYRDARITSIYEGTSQIQQIVISNSLLRD